MEMDAFRGRYRHVSCLFTRHDYKLIVALRCLIRINNWANIVLFLSFSPLIMKLHVSNAVYISVFLGKNADSIFLSLGAKLPKVYGWHTVLVSSPVLLWWIWKVLMEEKEERYAYLHNESSLSFYLANFFSKQTSECMSCCIIRRPPK
jgi:hypothetical protein